MDPYLVDNNNITPTEIFTMISSQQDLSIDPSNIPGPSMESPSQISYQMYQIDSSPDTDFSSSSGPPQPRIPGFLDGNQVREFFGCTDEDIRQEEILNQQRANVAQQMVAKVMRMGGGGGSELAIQPESMYPTPPNGSEVSPRAAQTALYHVNQHPGSSYHPVNYSSPEMSSPAQSRRNKRARVSSPGTSIGYEYRQPLLQPQTPHSISSHFDHKSSPPFHRYEENVWVPLFDERQQKMNALSLFIHADRGLMYKERQEAYVNYRKTHLQLTVMITCEECDIGWSPKYIWLGNFIRIREFQIQVTGVRHHNPMSTVLMKQSDKNRKQYNSVFEGFQIETTSTQRVLKHLHFSSATQYNNQINGMPNPKQEFFDLVVRLVAITDDGNQYIIQSYIAHKIICRAGNPQVFGDDNEINIKEELAEEEDQIAPHCWECRQNVTSTMSQVVVGGHSAEENTALTVRGDVFISGALRRFCDARCKQIYSEKIGADLKIAYDQLKELKIFEFSYLPEFAAKTGLSTKRQVGVIAQNVQETMPEAVVELGDFLSVDHAEIFIKSVSALKHLSSMAEEMQGNLHETMNQVAYILETVNNRKKIRASFASGLDSRSRRSSSSTVTLEPRKSKRPNSQYDDIFCGSRLSRCTIISVVVGLVFVMAACLVSMTFLYFVDLTSRYGHNPVPTVFVSHRTQPPENMVVPVNQLANLQQNVSMLTPKCEGNHCHVYCCDKETIGNATAHMLRENVIVPWRDDEDSYIHFGPLPDIQIYISELNITLDKSFCVSQSCNRHKRQYKLFIPLSPAFPKGPLRVKITPSVGKRINFCGEVDGFRQKRCMGSETIDKYLKVRKIDENEFELPVGSYLQSGYRFRIGYTEEACDPLSLLLIDQPRIMEEFNLIFYRKCF